MSDNIIKELIEELCPSDNNANEKIDINIAAIVWIIPFKNRKFEYSITNMQYYFADKSLHQFELLRIKNITCCYYRFYYIFLILIHEANRYNERVLNILFIYALTTNIAWLENVFLQKKQLAKIVWAKVFSDG